MLITNQSFCVSRNLFYVAWLFYKPLNNLFYKKTGELKNLFGEKLIMC